MTIRGRFIYEVVQEFEDSCTYGDGITAKVVWEAAWDSARLLRIANVHGVDLNAVRVKHVIVEHE